MSVEELLEWLEKQRQDAHYDFLGIGINVAPPTQAKEIRWSFVVGNQNEAYQNICLQIGRGLAGNVWKIGRMQIEEHLKSSPAKTMEYPIVRLERLNAVAVLPLIEDRLVVGVLLAGHRELATIDRNSIPLLATIADQTKAKLEELGIIDPTNG
jgi:nitrogen regulatory protein A